MRCTKVIVPMVVLVASVTALAQMSTYSNVGRRPSRDEIQAWDITVGPAGKELPPGSGTVKEGAEIYARRCVACHGPTGTEAKWYSGRLVGGRDVLTADRATRTLGNYWPYATSIWTYIYRAMPQGAAGSLSANEAYALTAFLLYRNGIIKESEVMDAETLPKVQMPNLNGFVPARPGESRPWKWAPGER